MENIQANQSWRLPSKAERETNMIKRFITWLYTRYVLQPEICAGLAAMQEPEFEIVVVPDVVFEAQIQANYSVKH